MKSLKRLPIDYPKACPTSPIISSICSSPTETLTIPSVIPDSVRSSLDSLLCVVDAGCVTILLLSPKLAERDSNFIESKNCCPACNPPLTSKATTQPPAFICFLATACLGCDLRNGYFTQFTFL